MTTAPPGIDRSPYPVPHPTVHQQSIFWAGTRQFHESVLDFGQCFLPDDGLLVWRRCPAGFDASMNWVTVSNSSKADDAGGSHAGSKMPSLIAAAALERLSRNNLAKLRSSPCVRSQ